MTEQALNPDPTPPEERTSQPHAQNMAATMTDRTHGHPRIRRRFGEECLRWPESPVKAFPRGLANSRRRPLGWLLAAPDSPSRHWGSPPASWRRHAIPREHGPPAGA